MSPAPDEDVVADDVIALALGRLYLRLLILEDRERRRQTPPPPEDRS